jgi:L,D-transpeptidase catalytic domain
MRVPSIALLSSLWLCIAPTPSASADVLISIDKASQRMSVSVNGQQRHAWPISSGAAGYDTPSGSFRPLRMERAHFSKEWDNAPMPYSIFFTPDGHAIHGTNHTRQLGRPASHGCVRLAPRQAAVLFALVRAEGLANTQVVVEGEDADVAIQSGSGIAVNPLAALQQAASARSKWQAEPIASSSSTATSSARSIREGDPGAGLPAPGVAAGLPGPETGSPSPATAQAAERDALLSRLLNAGTQAAKVICTRC